MDMVCHLKSHSVTPHIFMVKFIRTKWNSAPQWKNVIGVILMNLIMEIVHQMNRVHFGNMVISMRMDVYVLYTVILNHFIKIKIPNSCVAQRKFHIGYSFKENII